MSIAKYSRLSHACVCISTHLLTNELLIKVSACINNVVSLTIGISIPDQSCHQNCLPMQKRYCLRVNYLYM